MDFLLSHTFNGVFSHIQYIFWSIVSRYNNKIIAILETNRRLFCNFFQIQLKINNSYLQFFLWLWQLTVFILVFITKKSLNILQRFFMGCFLRMNLKFNYARGQCNDNTATMSRKKSSVATQIKSLK